MPKLLTLSAGPSEIELDEGRSPQPRHTLVGASDGTDWNPSVMWGKNSLYPIYYTQ